MDDFKDLYVDGTANIASMNISLDDFEPMLAGCLDPITAFMGGKMKVSGDMK